MSSRNCLQKMTDRFICLFLSFAENRQNKAKAKNKTERNREMHRQQTIRYTRLFVHRRRGFHDFFIFLCISMLSRRHYRSEHTLGVHVVNVCVRWQQELQKNRKPRENEAKAQLRGGCKKGAYKTTYNFSIMTTCDISKLLCTIKG